MLFFVVLAWGIYCFVHSLLITPRVVEWMRGHLGAYFKYYRLSFNAIALATLSLPIYITYLAGGPKIISYSGSWINVYYILVLLAIVVFGYAIFCYDWEEFFGFKQIREGDTEHTTINLSTKGALGLVRHPLYLSALLLLWAGEANLAQLLARGVLTIYILIGIQLEERKLVAHFGQVYRDYQKQVPMLIPKLKFLSQLIVKPRRLD